MIDGYDWAGGREAMLRFGPAGGPVVVAALPLLEEANRTRSFVVAVLRALAGRRIAGVLPDLPGTGESLVPTEQLRLGDLEQAFAAAARQAGSPALAFSIRSGALLDRAAAVVGRCHLAPQDGPMLTRELARLRSAGSGSDYGGNRLSDAFLAELADAQAMDARVLRMESDPQPAARKFFGAPLWRRAEPDNDLALAAAIADDLAGWVRACAS